MSRKRQKDFNVHVYDRDCCQCHYNSSEMCPNKLTDIKWRKVCEHWGKKYNWRYEKEWNESHPKPRK